MPTEKLVDGTEISITDAEHQEMVNIMGKQCPSCGSFGRNKTDKENVYRCCMCNTKYEMVK